VSLVRAGDEQPLDVRLKSGEVLRFRCKALSDGGRMLSYGFVTDLVHQAEELAHLAMVDGLTGVYNRRRFLSLLDVEWERYRRYKRPLSLLMLDIDLFKSLNDRFGHSVDDQVLAHFARICQDSKRGADIAARIGGEEFALLLPETDIGEARIAAERIRQAVADNPVNCNGNDIFVTVSIGLATANPGMDDPKALMKAADQALYAAKNAGRNRVCSPQHDGTSVPRLPASAA
jgi:diguanylate cyclase (GGDEF)-like protein